MTDKGGKREPRSSTHNRAKSNQSQAVDHENKKSTRPSVPRKRLASDPESSETTNKVARRSGRSLGRSLTQSIDLINFILSSQAKEFCIAEGESAIASDQRTYTTTVPLTPFEELLSAVILSRPISHKLGQRAIRTILNSPYEFRTPSSINTAGVDKVHEALELAKTQHRQKTASEIVLLAGTISEKFADNRDGGGISLDKLRKDVNGNLSSIGETLQTIKGLGKTGIQIFLRRIQATWPEFYPFIDDRTKKSLDSLHLASDANDLRNLVKENWSKIKAQDLGGNSEEQQRNAFVILLERSIGADLNGNIEKLLERVSK